MQDKKYFQAKKKSYTYHILRLCKFQMIDFMVKCGRIFQSYKNIIYHKMLITYILGQIIVCKHYMNKINGKLKYM